MVILLSISILMFAYLLGATPFGLIIVKLKTGQDIRKIESGRTGGTNAMRAAGFWAGFATAILDILKGAVAVWVVRAAMSANLLPPNAWLEILAPSMTVLGHNYSIFLAERKETGGWRLRGGAGGAPAAGGLVGLWWPNIFIIVPVGIVFLFLVGYASLATLSVGVVAVGVFAYRAALGLSPWVYVFYGVMVEILLAWALRPNIKRLLNGTERLIGLRARRSATKLPDLKNHQTR